MESIHTSFNILYKFIKTTLFQSGLPMRYSKSNFHYPTCQSYCNQKWKEYYWIYLIFASYKFGNCRLFRHFCIILFVQKVVLTKEERSNFQNHEWVILIWTLIESLLEFLSLYPNIAKLKRIGLIMFGHLVVLLYNNKKLGFAIALVALGKPLFLKVVCSNGVKRVRYQRPWRLRQVSSLRLLSNYVLPVNKFHRMHQQRP